MCHIQFPTKNRRDMTDKAPQQSDPGAAGAQAEESESEARRKVARSWPHLGMACVTLSALLFSLVTALLKATAMNVFLMLQVRSVLQWLLFAGAARALAPGARDAVTLFGERRQRRILFLRAGVYWGFVSLWWHAIADMPVGDATALGYCAPLFAALFGWLLLGERVPRRVYACLALSLLGVGLIVQPTFLFGREAARVGGNARYTRGMLYALGSAITYGLLPVLVRKTKECHWATVEHVTSLCSSLLFTPIALVAMAPSNPDLWEGIRDPSKLLALGLVALLGFAGNALLTYGYQRERVARAAAMSFLEIPCTYWLQYLLFGHLLTPVQALGVLCVIVSGLIILCPARAAPPVPSAPRAPRGGGAPEPDPPGGAAGGPRTGEAAEAEPAPSGEEGGRAGPGAKTGRSPESAVGAAAKGREGEAAIEADSRIGRLPMRLLGRLSFRNNIGDQSDDAREGLEAEPAEKPSSRTPSTTTPSCAGVRIV